MFPRGAEGCVCIVIEHGLLFLGVWLVLAGASGYPTYLLLTDKGSDEAPIDLVEFGFALLLLGTLVTGWVALTLLQVGQFTPGRAVLLATTLPAVAWGIANRRRLRFRAPALRFTRFTCLCLGLCFMALALFFHPDEFILGGGDAGVYVNLGAVWSRSGSFRISEPDLVAIPRALWPGLFRQSAAGHVADFVRLPGFYMSSDEPGGVTPQFFPLHPVWIALAHGLFGLEASLYTTPLWAVMGLLALVLTVRRLFGEGAGLIAGGLLLLTPLQIYFARYPTAETLTQFLLWGGLYALSVFATKGTPLWGVVGGMALGQVFLTRIDALPLVIVPGIWLLLTLIQGSWHRERWFLVPFSLLLLQSIIQSLVLSWPYTWEIYQNLGRYAMKLLRQGWWLIPIAVGLGALVYAALRRRSGLSAGQVISMARKGGALMLVALALFGAFVWPRIGETKTTGYWYGGHTIPVQNHLNLVRLGWYLSPLGIGLAIGGMVWIILREEWRRVWPHLVVGLSFSVLYLYDILNNPYHMYAMRRYVPAVLPFFVMGMAYTISGLWALRHRWRLARWVGGVAACVLVGLLAYNSRAVWNLVEYRGVVSQVRALAAGLKPNAVLLFDDDAPVGVGATIGTPLQYLFGFTAFDLQESALDEEGLHSLVTSWHRQGRTVYWVMGPRPALGLPEWALLQPELGTWIHTSRLETSYFEFPDDKVAYTAPLEFYRMMPDPAADRLVHSASIDIGTLDTAYLDGGFHDKELLGARSMRWTDGLAILRLPCAIGEEGESRVVTVTAAAVRPSGVAPAHVTLTTRGQTLGQYVLGSEFEALKAPIVCSTSGDGVELEITSDVWVPADHGVGGDTRTLGIMVDTVAISAEGASE